MPEAAATVAIFDDQTGRENMRQLIQLRWIAVVGLCVSCVLAVAGAVGTGRTPFRAALAIAGADVAVFVFGADALTSAAHLSGALR